MGARSAARVAPVRAPLRKLTVARAATVAEVTDASFADDVLKSSVPVLVDFWAPCACALELARLEPVGVSVAVLAQPQQDPSGGTALRASQITRVAIGPIGRAAQGELITSAELIRSCWLRERVKPQPAAALQPPRGTTRTSATRAPRACERRADRGLFCGRGGFPRSSLLDESRWPTGTRSGAAMAAAAGSMALQRLLPTAEAAPGGSAGGGRRVAHDARGCSSLGCCACTQGAAHAV